MRMAFKGAVEHSLQRKHFATPLRCPTVHLDLHTNIHTATPCYALGLLPQTLEMELPDTAASIRLSSLELSDCMSELGALGNDVSAGVRSAAQIVTSLEAGARQGVGLVGSVVVPALARRETRVRGGLLGCAAAGGPGDTAWWLAVGRVRCAGSAWAKARMVDLRLLVLGYAWSWVTPLDRGRGGAACL